ncbi:zinc finger domain-containing protein [Streptomyces sp. KR55]|uniref:zinc finger domain-containing protein n=1 Tax=Streptomyces sp. KR55 TaxID=3457425 RepID=UPI003FD4A385
MDTTPNDWQRENLPPLAVACPDCGSAAGQLCTSHSGTRVRNSQVHQARTAAWEAAQLAANPAAKLVADAVAEKRIRHGKHAAELLDAHGHTAEAEWIRRAVSERNGLMSAKQAAALILDEAEGGES